MKISRSSWLLSGVVGGVLLLAPLMASATPCEEACSAKAPTCECVCACYGEDMAVSTGHSLPAVNTVQHIVRSDSSQFSLLLATDIFRPPIA